MTYGTVTQKTKKAWYIIQAIQSWKVTYKDIVADVQERYKPLWFISDVYIKHITNKLEMKGYIKSVKVGRTLTRSLLREIRGQIDIEF